MLRYKSEGEVHKDFHGLTCATLHYLLDNYGEQALKSILTKTAQEVYRTIHQALKNGDTVYFDQDKIEITSYPSAVSELLHTAKAKFISLITKGGHVQCFAARGRLDCSQFWSPGVAGVQKFRH